MLLAEKDALIVVDAQNDFIDGPLTAKNAADVVVLIEIALDKFKRAMLPCFLTACDHPENHCSFIAQGGKYVAHGVRGTEGAQITPKLSRFINTSTMILKGQSSDVEELSAFDNPALHTYLQLTGVNRLFVCGFVTDICILATVLAGLKLGYTVILLCDAIAAADINEGDGMRAVEQMYKAGALARTVQWIKER